MIQLSHFLAIFHCNRSKTLFIRQKPDRCKQQNTKNSGTIRPIAFAKKKVFPISFQFHLSSLWCKKERDFVLITSLGRSYEKMADNQNLLLLLLRIYRNSSISDTVWRMVM